MNTLDPIQRSAEVPSAVQSNSASFHDKDAIDLGEILRVLKRQKAVMASVVAVIMILTLVILLSVTPRYTAYTLVEINPRQTQIVNFDSVLAGLPGGDDTIQTEIKIIESRRIAQRVIVSLDLNRDPEFNPALRAEGMFASLRRSLAEWIAAKAVPQVVNADTEEGGEVREQGGLADRIILALVQALSPTTEVNATDDERVAQEMDRTVDFFLENLVVKSENRSRVIRISFESISPKTAAAVTNTIADFYIVAQLEAKFEATKRAMTWLNQRVEELRKEVAVKERAIEEYRTRSGLLQGGSQTTLTTEQVSELNAQHVLELAKLAEAQARLRQTNELLKSPNGIDSAVDVLQSQLIQDLRRSETGVEQRIAELSEEYGERHPAMINARAELRDLQHKIQVEVDRVIQGLRNEVAIAQARAASLGDSLEQVKNQVAQHNQAEVDLRALERDANAARTLLETLMQRTKQTASQENFQEADANVVSYAATPRQPSFPPTGLILILSFAGSLTVAVLVALASDRLDFGFRSADQISHQLGVRPLGLLPRLSKLVTMGSAPHEFVLTHPESAFAEGIRTLYTNVLLTDVANRPKVVLITSALPREGKTAVSLSLARLMAMVGNRVIIVDCDLRRPSVQKELGFEPGEGLVECLTSEIQIEDVVKEDKASGVHVMGAGRSIHNCPEQLDSVQMQKLLRTLARRYDLVILDTAPLLAVSDTLFLSRLADKTVFLVRWAQTRRAVVSLAVKQLMDAQADLAGVFLTMVDVKANAKYGYSDSNLYHGVLKKYYTK